MPFESLPTTPDADELVDSAFSRAARTGRAKTGVDAQHSMLEVAGNKLSDNLEHVVRSWPDLDELHPFHREIVEAVVGINELRSWLASVGWASRQIEHIQREATSSLGSDSDAARRRRKQAFARMADIVDEITDDLEALETTRQELARLPGIDPEQPTVVLAGYPNVGKSSFLNEITRAQVAIDTYPFTTTSVSIGHIDHRHVTHQVVDTPGLLDRPAAQRNDIERQAMAAIDHLADAIIVLLDPSESCGYPLADQVALRDELLDRFATSGVPVITVCNKSDLSTDVEADYYMSVTEDDGVDAVVTAALEAIDYEPELPFEST